MFFDCFPPDATIVIPAPEPTLAEAALDIILQPLQRPRERFIAITGFGLETEQDLQEEPSLTRRIVLNETPGHPRLSYLAAGFPAGRTVIFIHGSPGVAEEWVDFLVDVPEGQYWLAVDRPGFGESAAGAITDLQSQAAAVASLLPRSQTPGAVLVGYSYGGPVALRMAADYPDRVGAVLLIGSAADPEMEEISPLQELAALDAFSLLLPQELENANLELLALRPQLDELAGVLGQIEAPVTIVQGLSDTLVPPENALYLKRMLPQPKLERVILIEGADHFLPWTHVDLLREALACTVADAARQSAVSSSPSVR